MHTVDLTGKCGRDPESKFLEDGTQIASTSLADRKSRADVTLWYEIEAWDKSAEILQNYVSKGKSFGVTGRIKMQKWQDRDSGEERQKMSIVADRIHLLGNLAEQSQTEQSEDF